MNKISRTLRAAAAVALVSACGVDGDHPTAPVALEPSFGFTNGPSSAGAVFRAVLDGVQILGYSTDPDRNLMSIQGPASNTVLCGGTQTVSGVELQQVTTPADGILKHFATPDPVPVAVFATADVGQALPFPEPICSFFYGPLKVAEGLAQGTVLFRLTPVGELQVVQHLEGLLDAVGGGKVHYSETQVCRRVLSCEVESILLLPAPDR